MDEGWGVAASAALRWPPTADPSAAETPWQPSAVAKPRTKSGWPARRRVRIAAVGHLVADFPRKPPLSTTTTGSGSLSWAAVAGSATENNQAAVGPASCPTGRPGGRAASAPDRGGLDVLGRLNWPPPPSWRLPLPVVVVDNGGYGEIRTNGRPRRIP